MTTQGKTTKADGIFTGLRVSDLQIIGSTWMRFAFRSGGGVVSLFLVLVIGLMIPVAAITQIEKLATPMGASELSQSERIKMISESSIITGIVEGLVEDGDDDGGEITSYLIKEKPAMLSLALLMMLYIVPFGACAAAFNQTAGDIGSRGLRFILPRVERSNIFLGRFISAFLFVTLSFVILISVVTGYLYFKISIYSFSDLALWGMQGIVSYALYALPYVALAAWISCCMKSAFSAMAMTYLAALGPSLFLQIVKAIFSKFGLDWLPKLMPWGWKFNMFSNDMGDRMMGYGVMLGFTVLFLLVGLMTFRKRDL
ncbi:MAG: hypothetical protein ACI97A_000946 [Planctomycetota bacterium]|jgi:hypothetical protein